MDKYYFTIQDETIMGIGQCPCSGEGFICIEVTKEQYKNVEDKGNGYYIYQNGTLIINPDYEQKLIDDRKESFYKEFMYTSLGNYRLQPKGYANAQQSIDTINNMVNAIGSLVESIAKKIIFYDTPDFTDETQCTEEWLIEHQHNPSEMTLEQWKVFYVEFTTLYAEKQYQ